MRDQDILVGFVGLGNMGWPMARNLATGGIRLVVADAKDGVAEAFAAETGAIPAASLQELAHAAAVIILMLPNGDIVREVLLGDNGIAPHTNTGNLVIDMSSCDPVGTQEIGKALAEHGVEMLDAPVSGGVKRAVTGELAIMIGGEQGLYERVKPLLDLMGNKVFRAGPLGAGHAIKALNNYVSAAGLVAAADAVRIAARFGIAPGDAIDILNASSGRNNSTEVKFHQFILSETYNSGFSLSLMAKDIGIALEMAKEKGSFAPLLTQCLNLWREAGDHLPPDTDHTGIFKYLQERDGSGVR
ncbi:MAG: NAD(P)-dependent oxidoreductase [Ectothiorhodospiraceae bacterium]|nr:NAD(P)-dependent oxidoreductase [Ectothiorhodospiraceae bacterium]